MKFKNCISYGEGPRPLIIIPGLSMVKVTADEAALMPLMKSFGPNYTVYLFDRPDEVPEDCTNEWLAEELASRMVSMGISDAYVIGVSQGGMMAQFIAANHPELVHALVLAATLCWPNDTFVSVLTSWRDMAKEEKYFEMNMDCFSRLYTDDYLERNSLGVKKMSEIMRPYGKEWFIRLCNAGLTAGASDRLGNIKCPVLVIGSNGDPVVLPKGSQEIAAALGCELYMYDGYRHAIYDESPDFYPRALSFFDSL